MKKTVAAMAVLILLLGTAACGVKTEPKPELTSSPEMLPIQQEMPELQPVPTEPEPVEEAPEETEVPIVFEPSQGLDAYDNPCDHPHEGKDLMVFDGIYRAQQPHGEDEQTWLQIRGYNDHILLEYHGMIEGCVYRFWAEEFWPAEYWYTDPDSSSVHGKSQQFSSMAQYENYSGLPQSRDISLTEDGVVLCYDGADAEYFVRDDGFGGGHTAAEELRTYLGEEVHLDFAYQYDAAQVLGTWGFWSGWDAVCMTFAEDGTFSLYWKTPNRPIQTYEGVYGFGTYSGNLEIFAERFGYGRYPYRAGWEWYVDETGYLTVRDGDGIMFDGQYTFWPVEDAFFAVMDADTALGYIVERVHEQGDYTDQYGLTYSYYYSLPQFYHSDHSDLQQINGWITEFYYPIIEEEMAAMGAGDILSYDYVDWQSAVYRGILFLHVYAYTYDWEEHHTFYIDVQTMEALEPEEMLDRLDIDKTFFLDTVRTCAEQSFLNRFSDIPVEEREMLGYDQCLAKTVSDEFVNPGLPIFVTGSGEICVYLKISSMAGSGLIWEPIYPFLPEYAEEAVG